MPFQELVERKTAQFRHRFGIDLPPSLATLTALEIAEMDAKMSRYPGISSTHLLTALTLLEPTAGVLENRGVTPKKVTLANELVFMKMPKLELTPTNYSGHLLPDRDCIQSVLIGNNAATTDGLPYLGLKHLAWGVITNFDSMAFAIIDACKSSPDALKKDLTSSLSYPEPQPITDTALARARNNLTDPRTLYESRFSLSLMTEAQAMTNSNISIEEVEKAMTQEEISKKIIEQCLINISRLNSPV